MQDGFTLRSAVGVGVPLYLFGIPPLDDIPALAFWYGSVGVGVAAAHTFIE
jgi:hypothetical protein